MQDTRRSELTPTSFQSIEQLALRSGNVRNPRPRGGDGDQAGDGGANDGSATPDGSLKVDEAVICDWMAQSFGMYDEEYYTAYSREVIRQSKVTMGTDQLPAWF